MKQFRITYTCYIEPRFGYFDVFEDVEEIYNKTKRITRIRTITADNEQHAIKKLKRKHYCPISINNIEEVARYEEFEHAF